VLPDRSSHNHAGACIIMRLRFGVGLALIAWVICRTLWGGVDSLGVGLD